MKVLFATTPPAEFAFRWAEPSVAGMCLVDPIAAKRRRLVENAERKKKEAHLGILQRSGQK
jgi:hypothetical protein